MANGIGITRGVLDWEFQSNYVERAMDNAAYQASHPDDTLVVAGPARYASISEGGTATTGISSLMAIGALQSVQFTQIKPTQPMMMIGSGRSFFLSGKATTQWNIGRLFINGRNLLRALYHNAVAGGLPVHMLDDPAARQAQSKFFANLDSELYYVPFGLGCFFRSKAHDFIGSFYAELSMINTWSIGFNAGQSLVMESVSGMSDRILPMELHEIAGNNSSVARATIDAVLDFATATEPTGVVMDDNLA